MHKPVVAERNNAIDKVVVSDTLTSADTAPWHTTRIVRRADAHAQIAELKRGPGRDILVFGTWEGSSNVLVRYEVRRESE